MFILDFLICKILNLTNLRHLIYMHNYYFPGENYFCLVNDENFGEYALCVYICVRCTVDGRYFCKISKDKHYGKKLWKGVCYTGASSGMMVFLIR